MSRLLDLDHLGPEDLGRIETRDLEALFQVYEERRQLTEEEPEWRQRVRDLAHEARRAGRITEAEQDAILSELNRAHVGVVLSGHLEQLVRPEVLTASALGAFPRPRPRPAVDAAEEGRRMAREDPDQLAAVVQEMMRFTQDTDLIIESAVAYAKACNIPEEVFAPIITRAVRPLVLAERGAIHV